MAARLPVIWLISNHSRELFTTAGAAWEEKRLECHWTTDDGQMQTILATIQPDCILTLDGSPEDYENLSAASYEVRRRWIHRQNEESDESLGNAAWHCAFHFMMNPLPHLQPLVSVFTPVYKSRQRIQRGFISLQQQTYQNWEWILFNDADDTETLAIIEALAATDHRVRVYNGLPYSHKRIGDVKYKAACMASGDFLVELDHDDDFTPRALESVVAGFDAFPQCGFAYSDCAEVDPLQRSYTYGEGFAFNYGSYYDAELQGITYKVARQPNINPLTIRHIVGVPNHFRAWRKNVYHAIGGHNRLISVCDDYELLVRTFLGTRMLHIATFGYRQFLEGETGMSIGNTQESSRADIQRRVKATATWYDERIHQRFEELALHDWAWDNQAGRSFLSAPPRFAADEQAANFVFQF